MTCHAKTAIISPGRSAISSMSIVATFPMFDQQLLKSTSHTHCRSHRVSPRHWRNLPSFLYITCLRLITGRPTNGLRMPLLPTNAGVPSELKSCWRRGSFYTVRLPPMLGRVVAAAACCTLSPSDNQTGVETQPILLLTFYEQHMIVTQQGCNISTECCIIR